MTSYAAQLAWGAAPLPQGGARFRLWAPALPHLTLVATDSGAKLKMQRGEDWWFELSADLVPVGGGYQFELPGGQRVPDPAARAQVGDVHGPSRLVDPAAYDWQHADWSGRPWEQAVIYELHTGTFSPEGTFAGIERRLDHLAWLGITAIELMPVAQFGGKRGWGYDGVLLYAPHQAYGGPEALKRLIDAIHARGLMALLDVVYNHFGPDGNFLGLHAPEFFHAARMTPWGAAIAYEKRPVRDYFIQNALYWLEEYRFDGLRLDAIDQIHDPSTPPILEDLAAAVRDRIAGRHIHLTTEDDRNTVRLHERDDAGRPKLYTAEWNDDYHHAVHALATSERDGYYQDYGTKPAHHLLRALKEGFVYQGEPSAFRDGEARGERSADLPPTAFINFLQNHDQIGNRAFGERLTTITNAPLRDALTALLLLAPQIPLIYMGEEWGETRPFLYFTDFGGDLGRAVREGRRNEFRKWPKFSDPALREKIPDPNSQDTFAASLLDWTALGQPAHAARLLLVRNLLNVRAREIAPRLAGICGGKAGGEVFSPDALAAQWQLGDGSELVIAANLGDGDLTHEALDKYFADARIIFPEGIMEAAAGRVPAFAVIAAIRKAKP